MVPAPRALVIPFAVPKEGEGLGLGLAALIQGFARLEGGVLGLAQVMPRGPGGHGAHLETPLEAFLAPDAWKSLAERGDTPADVSTVVTGAFQPPDGGAGHIQLLAFDTKDGTPRARSEAHLDEATAGRGIVDALAALWKTLGGELGPLADVGELDWEALESVLRAERCALHDPRRGAPHDRFAAMVHLGRAVSDAPSARFPAGRLAALAIEAVMSSGSDQGAEAALRVLHRACEDAPDRIELLEATAGLHVRLGHAAEAEAAALELVGRDPKRPSVYALLAEARRVKGDAAGAEAALARGFELDPGHPVLLTEQGVLLAARGEEARAAAAWERALLREPLFPPAFVNLADLVAQRGDAVRAGALVDRALASRAAHPEILRRAILISSTCEAPGLAQAARVAQLSRALLAFVPNDAMALLALARALKDQGERDAARARFLDVERAAPRSVLSAAAQHERFILDHKETASRLEGLRRLVTWCEGQELEDATVEVAEDAERHAGWFPRLVLGMYERQRGEWLRARSAFESAIEHCPGASQAHIAAVECCVALGEGEAAIRHATAALELEGEKPDTLGVLASACLAAGRLDDAEQAVARALVLAPENAPHLSLRDQIAAARGGPPARPSFVARLLASLKRAEPDA